MSKPATAKGKRPPKRPCFEYGGCEITAGTRQELELRVARLPAGNWATMPTAVVHGKHEGPTVWLSGAIHGDELNGIEIVRQVIGRLDPRAIAGTVIAVPIVNVFGVTLESRYLPDRRDLNRSFPGSKRGSLAKRVAHLFFDTVVSRCDFGIDFHTGSGGRANLPQIRCDLDHDRTRELAVAFGAPVALHASIRDGSLRAAARDLDVPVLLYEAGEALRFSPSAIQMGVEGALRCLYAMGVLPADLKPDETSATRTARDSKWVRATRSGFCHPRVALGDAVTKGDCLAVVTDSIQRAETRISASSAGIVIGLLHTATVHRGDAVVHIATPENTQKASGM